MFKKFALSIFALGLATTAAHATPITYEGTISPGGEVVTDSLISGDNFNDPANWDYWSFHATAGDLISITIERLESDLDPAFGLFSGLFADTNDLPGSDPTDGSLAFADDEIGHAGPWGDPQLLDFLIVTSGYYTIAATSFASGPDDGQDGLFDYRMTVRGNTDVPEPAALGLLGLGLAGLWVNRRRKRS